MTPKDALIEKMARAMYITLSSEKTPWESARKSLRRQYVQLARAAYEAEHEETKG